MERATGAYLALDAKTGKMRWSADNHAATLAGPITYSLAGAQYVAVTAGYGGAFFLIDSFLGPAEGNSAQRPRLRLQAGRHGRDCRHQLSQDAGAKTGDMTVSAGEHHRGAQLYERNCTLCHGGAAKRRSPPRSPPVDWDSVRRSPSAMTVVDGERAPLGMPRFERYVSPPRRTDPRACAQAGEDGTTPNRNDRRGHEGGSME